MRVAISIFDEVRKGDNKSMGGKTNGTSHCMIVSQAPATARFYSERIYHSVSYNLTPMSPLDEPYQPPSLILEKSWGLGDRPRPNDSRKGELSLPTCTRARELACFA